MSYVTTLFVLAGIVTVVAAVYDTSPTSFDHWAIDNGREYHSTAERRAAYRNFVANAAVAKDMQRRNPHAVFGATRFADMDLVELRARRRSPRRTLPLYRRSRLGGLNQNLTRVPFIDWRSLGAVTPVGDNGVCTGAGPGFGAAANIEGVNYVTNQQLVPLSVSQIVGCTTGTCNYMDITRLLDWLDNSTYSTALATAASYPFPFTPPARCPWKVRAGATVEYTKRLDHDENAMATVLVKTGPIAAAVDASRWFMYTKGILTDCPRDEIDDVVAIVGYNDISPISYWIIKNSWGKQWGEEGYIRIAKGSNQCGIDEFSWTVVVQPTN